jgi:hypothetical protein
MSDNVPEFLKRAADKCGFIREKYIEKNIPTSFENVVVLVFFGTMRAEFILSSLLINKIKEKHPSKYLIVCSYPGRSGIYDVDEYWALREETAVKTLMDNAVGFDNLSKDRVLFLEQQLNKFFENVVSMKDYVKFYNNGFTKEFFDEFKWISYNLPTIPSSKVEFNKLLAQKSGYKVFVHPSRTLKAWNKGREIVLKSRIDFWYGLLNKMLNDNFQPVVYQDQSTFDVSKEFESRCVYCTESKITDVLGAMRTTGCVLDVFSGISRFSSIARTPFIACTERNLYNGVKEWETDSLCNSILSHRYIFTFPTIIESGHWNELATNIVSKLESFIPRLNRDEWPSTVEQSIVLPYSMVKKTKTKKIGAHFIKVPKI